LGNLGSGCLILFDKLASLLVVCLVLLVKLDLVHFGLLLQGLTLLVKLLVEGFQLLREEGDLSVLSGHCLVEGLSQVVDFVIELVLNLLSLFLLEQYLVLVVDFSFCESLVALLPHIVESLLKADFLGVIEFLEFCELLLRLIVDFSDRVLQLLLLLFQLLFELINSLLEALLGLL